MLYFEGGGDSVLQSDGLAGCGDLRLPDGGGTDLRPPANQRTVRKLNDCETRRVIMRWQTSAENPMPISSSWIDSVRAHSTH